MLHRKSLFIVLEHFT